MQQRNRLLGDEVRDVSRLEPFERVMAEAGVAIAALRAAAVAELMVAVSTRRDAGGDRVFPWAELAVVGSLETALGERPAGEVEDDYCAELAAGRERDRAAGRTLEGPHRSDLAVGHGPKELPAKVCSTGEQKALLIGLLLAHCDAIAQRQDGTMPILILDEITAHLDPQRRAALFDEIVAMGTQAWMSGTDPDAFAALLGRGRFYCVEEGCVTASR
jgi:DNA replication and repair protein RecF